VPSCAQHLPGRHVLGESLEFDRPEVAVLEQATDQFSSARRNDNCARLGERLEPSGKVRRVANHRLLLSGTRADEVADHDKPGCNVDANLHRRTGIRCELRNPVVRRNLVRDSQLIEGPASRGGASRIIGL